MLVEYLFVCDKKNGTFPVRLRILRDRDRQYLVDSDELSGVITTDEEKETRRKLEQLYKKPDYDISRSWANTWNAVQNNYYGLQYHEYPPTQNQQRKYEPQAAFQKQEVESLETTATLKIVFIFFVGAILCFGFSVLIYPEFQNRYGGFYNWFLNLRYNPLYAASGIIMIVAIIAGVILLNRFIYYMRVYIKVDPQGITLQPDNRRVKWRDVEHLDYAHRKLRPYGVPLSAARSVRLHVREDKPVDIPHRFRNMSQLIALITKYSEPHIIARAQRLLNSHGEHSFGNLVTVTKKQMLFKNKSKTVFLDQIGKIAISGDAFTVTDKEDRMIFSCLVELVQDATILPQLVQKLQKAKR